MYEGPFSMSPPAEAMAHLSMQLLQHLYPLEVVSHLMHQGPRRENRAGTRGITPKNAWRVCERGRTRVCERGGRPHSSEAATSHSSWCQGQISCQCYSWDWPLSYRLSILYSEHYSLLLYNYTPIWFTYPILHLLIALDQQGGGCWTLYTNYWFVWVWSEHAYATSLSSMKFCLWEECSCLVILLRIQGRSLLHTYKIPHFPWHPMIAAVTNNHLPN